MIPQSWQEHWAEILNVKQPDRLAQWLLRLFIIDVSGRPRSIHYFKLSHRWLHSIQLSLADNLGVTHPERLRDWIIGCFFILPKATSKTRRFDWIWGLVSPYSVPAFSKLSHTLDVFQNYMTPQSFTQQMLYWIIGLPVLLIIISIPFNIEQQASFFLITLVFALFIRRVPGSLSNSILIMLSLIATFRYAIWRVGQTLYVETMGDHIFSIILLLAESFTWVVAILSFVQTIMPLRRPPKPMPVDTHDWPSVDVFIPSYNEPLEIVRPTLIAAKGMDWPMNKLTIYLLDDGNRDDFRDFAEELGIEYIRREEHQHAKAGNLNHALTLTHGEFIAIFDCDHIPTRSFLQVTMGWMIADPNRALVQTPHHFFSPDPFERNLETFREVPNEGYLFNRMIQDGNDLWNAAFFCGSCAVIRRGPLEEVGGVAVETVTEDAHTALKLHRLGYESIYLNIPQAAGLATESLSAHIGQRIRWARGMVQIFRSDNPLKGPGLSVFQRLCYTNASIHFLFGVPRFIFLIAPLAYLFFELHFIHAEPTLLMLYVVPYILHANMANTKIQGKFRHAFWAEVYETVLASYIMIPTTLALINPKFGKFNVTPKGGLIHESFVDWKISSPYLILLILNLLGFSIGLGRLVFWNQFEAQVVVINLCWTVYNLSILGAAFSVASEAKQIRKSHRIPIDLPAILYLKNGRTYATRTHDFSSDGISISKPGGLTIEPGELVSVGLYRGDQEYTFNARELNTSNDHLGLKLTFASLAEESEFIQCTYSRADAWSTWHHTFQSDHISRSFKEVLTHSFLGYEKLFTRLVFQLRQL